MTVGDSFILGKFVFIAAEVKTVLLVGNTDQ